MHASAGVLLALQTLAKALAELRCSTAAALRRWGVIHPPVRILHGQVQGQVRIILQIAQRTLAGVRAVRRLRAVRSADADDRGAVGR